MVRKQFSPELHFWVFTLITWNSDVLLVHLFSCSASLRKTRFISNIPRVICYVNGPQDVSPDAGTSDVYTFQPASIHPPPQLENKPNHCSCLIKFSESPQSALQHPVWYVHNFTFLPLLSLNYMTSELALPVLSLQKGVVEVVKWWNEMKVKS